MPPADKARFHLEQSVPELHNLQRKEIFSNQEVRAVVQKRSDFEHIINARGCTCADYARYAEYEMNVASLITKRAKRKGVKNPMGHLGQRKVFYVLDRGVRRFPGDMRLWMQYLSFARSQKSYKKVEQILAQVLRLHPTKRELWVYAASFILEVEADVVKARAYLQRGLRLCSRDRDMWLEYARLELIYIAKISMRRKILGIEDNIGHANPANELDQEAEGDFIKLPGTEDAISIATKVSGENAVDQESLAKTPALTGAIPIAIFEAAMKEFKHDTELAARFFDLVSGFPQAGCSRHILSHIVDALSLQPMSAHTVICKAKLEVLDIPTNSSSLPGALRKALNIIQTALPKLLENQRNRLAQASFLWLSSYGVALDLDVDVAMAISVSTKTFMKLYENGRTGEVSDCGLNLSHEVLRLQRLGLDAEAGWLLRTAMEIWPGNIHLEALQITSSAMSIAGSA